MAAAGAAGAAQIAIAAELGEEVVEVGLRDLAATGDFSALHAKFRRRNTVIYGVSRDSMASHEKFRDKQGFKFDLISDPDERLCKKFDVVREKTLYGRKFMGVVRSTFLIDANGKLRREWRNVKVKGHAEEVLEALKEL